MDGREVRGLLVGMRLCFKVYSPLLFLYFPLFFLLLSPCPSPLFFFYPFLVLLTRILLLVLVLFPLRTVLHLYVFIFFLIIFLVLVPSFLFLPSVLPLMAGPEATCVREYVLSFPARIMLLPSVINQFLIAI